MKPKVSKYFLHSLQGQSTGFNLCIVALEKSKSQMFLLSVGRLFHITDLKYLNELVLQEKCVNTRSSEIRLRTKIIVFIYSTK